MSSKSSRYSVIKYLSYIACFWAGYTFFTSCNPNNGIGSNVLPASDLINANFQDTSTVRVYTLLKDSDRTIGTSYCMLGSYNDPIFGMEKASFYTQLLTPEASAYTYPAGVIIDSVILRLPFPISGTTYYGTLNPQTIEVYQIASNDSLKINTSYYSTDIIKYADTLIGKATITPNPISYVNVNYYDGTIWNFNPQISIKLSTKWLTENIVTPQAASVSNQSFIQHMHGLYVTVNNPLQLPGQGGIFYIDPLGYGGGLFVYQHVGVTRADTGSMNFELSNGAIYFSHFDHDYAEAPFYNSSGKDSVLSPYLTYLGGMGGTRILLNFPYLKNWVKKNKIIVNRAEIELPLVATDIGSDPPPGQLYLEGIYTDANGKDTAEYALPDQSLPNYGGTYNGFNQIYDFDIASYIQKVLDGNITDHGLYLVIGGSAVSANRVVLYGPVAMSSTSPRLRLKMFYTPLKS
ncbi:MAG TPA: DUF4270 family protein [Bacteroidia bacterium]|jgi:hypothetical protein|nr:DUF4270 family protein [Bacteroidia bacterium]